MENSQPIIYLCGDDVVKLQNEGEQIHLASPLFRMDEFEQRIKAEILGLSVSNLTDPSVYAKPKLQWLEDGVSCETLVARQGKWQTGKIKIKLSVEFIPDAITEPARAESASSESPLDDIRRFSIMR